MSRHITVIVMTSSQCNLSCGYCYARASQPLETRMSVSKIGQLIRNCSLGFDSVKFIWHGGEPLFMGMDFYKTVVKAQQEVKQVRGVGFVNTMQTNGLLVTSEWLNFCRDYGFSFALSFDAPPDVHDIQRPDKRNEVTVDDYLRIFEKIRGASFPLGLLCVVTSLNVDRGKEIFEFFKSVGATSYSLLPLISVPSVNSSNVPSNDQLARLYKTTFDLWLDSPNEFKSIEPVDTMMRSLMGQEPYLCSFNASCLVKMITITPTGEVVPCGSFDPARFTLGNVFEDPLTDILLGERTMELRRMRDRHIEECCGECDFVSICRGGCRDTALWSSGKYEGDYPYCQARKDAFEYIQRRLRVILSDQFVVK